MKYVIIDYNRAILFDESFVHSAFAINGDITSAGYFKIADGTARTYGKSIGLNMEPARDDEETINNRLGLICK